MDTLVKQNLKMEANSGRLWLLVVFITIISITVTIVHLPCLSSKAIIFDDVPYIIDNKLVKSPGWSSTCRFLSEISTPSTVHGYYQPLTMISLMIDYSIAGSSDNIRVFHRTSLALHVINTALIIILLYLLFGNALSAVSLGLIFGIHPLTVEPICWLSERKTLLAAFFSLISLICYVNYCKKSRKKFYAGSASFYILALMSKPTSIALPLMMIIMDFWPLKRLRVKSLNEKIPFFILGSIFAVITYISQARTSNVILPSANEPFRIPLIIFHNIIFYLNKIIWPGSLSPHYGFPTPMSLSNMAVLVGLIGTCIFIPLLFISLFKTKAIVAGWLMFFIMILPTMQLIGFSGVIASDKFAYLPFVGILMIFAFFVDKMTRRWKNLSWKYIILIVIFLIIAIGETFATRKYLVKWQQSLSLYKNMLKVKPDAAPVHIMMGLELEKQGYILEAEQHYKKAIGINSNSFHAHNNLGALYADQGLLDKAMDHFKFASQLRPNSADSQLNLGNLFLLKGEKEKAIIYLEKALAINDEYADAHNNLGILLAEQGKFDEAIQHFKRTTEIDPLYTQAYYHIGNVLRSKNQPEEAIEYFRQCLNLEPSFVEAHNNLGSLLLTTGKVDEAIKHFQTALKIDPGHENAAFYLKLAIETKERAKKEDVP
jgi:tetratricopeptide (TPR) repeat protein